MSFSRPSGTSRATVLVVWVLLIGGLGVSLGPQRSEARIPSPPPLNSGVSTPSGPAPSASPDGGVTEIAKDPTPSGGVSINDPEVGDKCPYTFRSGPVLGPFGDCDGNTVACQVAAALTDGDGAAAPEGVDVTFTFKKILMSDYRDIEKELDNAAGQCGRDHRDPRAGSCGQPDSSYQDLIGDLRTFEFENPADYGSATVKTNSSGTAWLDPGSIAAGESQDTTLIEKWNSMLKSKDGKYAILITVSTGDCSNTPSTIIHPD
jgi:hypothetical protein